jgi:hypothetical protein
VRCTRLLLTQSGQGRTSTQMAGAAFSPKNL